MRYKGTHAKKGKPMEASKRLAYWSAVVASACPVISYILAATGRDPISDMTSTIFMACIGYLITYAGKSLGEKVSRNRHGLDANGNPYNTPDTGETTPSESEAKG